MNECFFIALILEIILVSKIANRRIKIEKEQNIKLILITIIILCITYIINNKTYFIYYYLITPLIFMFYMDRTCYLIINEFNLLFFLLGIIHILYTFQFIQNISMSIICIIIMVIIKLIEKRLKKDLMGDGDLKFFIATSLIVSYHIFTIIFIASMISVIIEYLKRLITKKDILVPFGPYLVIAFLIFIYFRLYI